MSATAKRGNMQLIAVVMGAETRDIRNSIARSLLDYGFANYALYEHPGCALEEVTVLGGCITSVPVYAKPFSVLVNKSDLSRVELKYSIPEKITAPHKAQDVIGKIEFYISDKLVGSCDICVNEDIDKIDFGEVYKRVITLTVFGKKS